MKHGFSVNVQKTRKGWKPAREKGKNQKEHTNTQESVLEVPPTSHTTDTVIWSTLSLKLLTIIEALRQLTVWPYLTIYDSNWQYDNFSNVYEQEDFLLVPTCVFLMNVYFFSLSKKNSWALTNHCLTVSIPFHLTVSSKALKATRL